MVPLPIVAQYRWNCLANRRPYLTSQLTDLLADLRLDSRSIYHFAPYEQAAITISGASSEQVKVWCPSAILPDGRIVIRRYSQRAASS